MRLSCLPPMPVLMLMVLLRALAAESRTVQNGWTPWPTQQSTIFAPKNLSPTPGGTLPRLRLAVVTDPQIIAGLRVTLICFAFTLPYSSSVHWSWEKLDGETWQDVGTGFNLTLSQPEQSGRYRCNASAASMSGVSPVREVIILASHPTVHEQLGVAAFVISLLALIISVAILAALCVLWLGGTLSFTGAGAKAFPEPVKTPKEDLPPSNSDTSVYMNYTSTKQAYSDLDPAQMVADNFYASLS